MKRASALLGVAALLFLSGGQARAAGVAVLGVEDPVSGFVGPLDGPVPTITVGSDGDVGPWDPLGLHRVYSDFIRFDAPDNWIPVGGPDVFGPGAWEMVAPGTWILNEGPEPVGVWSFFIVSGWTPSVPTDQFILERPGSSEVSDVIRLFNDTTGRAMISFDSDPHIVPSPAAVLGGGALLLLIPLVRRFRRA